MHAIVLAAGWGTRLGKMTEEVPKALLPLGGRTILDFVIDSIWVEGITKIHIVHNGAWASRFRGWQKSLRWIPGRHERSEPPYLKLHNNGRRTNDSRLGAVADLNFVVQSMNRPDDLLVAFADNLHPPIELARLEGDSPAITVRRVIDIQHPEALGRVHIEAGFVSSIGPEAKHGWVFAGPAFLNRESLGFLQEYCDYHKKAEVAPDDVGKFFSKLDRVRAVRTDDGPFFDIGTMESYSAARFFLAHGRPQWRVRLR